MYKTDEQDAGFMQGQLERQFVAVGLSRSREVWRYLLHIGQTACTFS